MEINLPIYEPPASESVITGPDPQNEWVEEASFGGGVTDAKGGDFFMRFSMLRPLSRYIAVGGGLTMVEVLTGKKDRFSALDLGLGLGLNLRPLREDAPEDESWSRYWRKPVRVIIPTKDSASISVQEEDRPEHKISRWHFLPFSLLRFAAGEQLLASPFSFPPAWFFRAEADLFSYSGVPPPIVVHPPGTVFPESHHHQNGYVITASDTAEAGLSFYYQRIFSSPSDDVHIVGIALFFRGQQ